LSLEFAGARDAARLWGRAQSLREETGTPQPAAVRLRCDRHIAAARGQLNDDAAFDRAWTKGRSLNLEEVVRTILNA
jgi:hypothetical protein